MKTAYDVIIRPLITEQSMEDLDIKKYAFQVAKDANKIEIKNAIEEAQKAFYPVAEKLYKDAAPQGDASCAGDCGNCGSDNVVDADYETVD